MMNREAFLHVIYWRTGEFSEGDKEVVILNNGSIQICGFQRDLLKNQEVFCDPCFNFQFRFIEQSC